MTYREREADDILQHWREADLSGEELRRMEDTARQTGRCIEICYWIACHLDYANALSPFGFTRKGVAIWRLFETQTTTN